MSSPVTRALKAALCLAKETAESGVAPRSSQLSLDKRPIPKRTGFGPSLELNRGFEVLKPVGWLGASSIERFVGQ